jgi:hypothetical protein
VLKKLFGWGGHENKPRVRVCVECGQPVETHANWCAIARTQQELDRRQAAKAGTE